jgi:hypothetical protein
MTKLLKGLYVVGVAAVLAASATPTQAADLRCTVPFEFIVNNRALAAGTYDVSISGNVLAVRGSKDGAFVLVSRAESATNGTSKLVFHRFGDTYVLHQAWAGSTGRELPKSRREYSRRGEVAKSFERVEVPLL